MIEIIYAKNGEGKTQWAQNEKRINNAVVLNSKLSQFRDGNSFSFINTVKEEFDKSRKKIFSDMIKVSSLRSLFPNHEANTIKQLIKNNYKNYELLNAFDSTFTSQTSNNSILVKDLYNSNQAFIEGNIQHIVAFAISERILNGINLTDSIDVEEGLREINTSLNSIKEGIIEDIPVDVMEWIKQNKVSKEMAELIITYDIENGDTTKEYVANTLKSSEKWSEMSANKEQERIKLLTLPVLTNANEEIVEKIDVENLSDGEVVSKVINHIDEKSIILDDTLEKLDLNNLDLAIVNLIKKFQNSTNTLKITTHNEILFERVKNFIPEARTFTIKQEEGSFRLIGFNNIITTNKLLSNITDREVGNGETFNPFIKDFLLIMGRYTFKGARINYQIGRNQKNKLTYEVASKIHKGQTILKTEVEDLLSNNLLDNLSDTFNGTELLSVLLSELQLLSEEFNRFKLSKENIIAHLRKLISISELEDANERTLEEKRTTHLLDETIISIIA